MVILSCQDARQCTPSVLIVTPGSCGCPLKHVQCLIMQCVRYQVLSSFPDKGKAFLAASQHNKLNIASACFLILTLLVSWDEELCWYYSLWSVWKRRPLLRWEPGKVKRTINKMSDIWKWCKQMISWCGPWLITLALVNWLQCCIQIVCSYKT